MAGISVPATKEAILTKEELKKEINALRNKLEELSQEACELMNTADPFDSEDDYRRVDKSRVTVATELRVAVAGINQAIDMTRNAEDSCDTIEDEHIERYDPAADL